MSDHSLPKTIDPLKYADQAKVLEGQVSLSQLPRFGDMLVSKDGIVKVKLEFGRDQQGLRIVAGALTATVDLRCERCLEPVTKELSSDFMLGIVFSDEDAKQLPKSYEPLLLESDSLDTDVYELVEEELILSLPMFAYHETCEGDYQLDVGAEGGYQSDEQLSSSREQVRKDNPFSVLEGLKTKKD